ncbi:hypothetical protein [Brucella intermedia]|uniref:Uncharacterized protein n=1 Tax=Brucella intermedia M86 TaxID=1234597 RepID=M5JLF4_9HYPH|nr:hypothetical protein [Brucella intermedia]ELT47403.1 hypothetical protein D584_19923 [Brucella intermedia M86]
MDKPSRFDNLPTDELLQKELQTRVDRRELLHLIEDRFKAEAQKTYTFGMAYRIASGRFAGRAMILEYVVVGGKQFSPIPQALFPLAEGRLSIPHGMRPWTTKTQQVRLESLDPSSGYDPQVSKK